jgi:hypothetical protein
MELTSSVRETQTIGGDLECRQGLERRQAAAHRPGSIA